MYLDVSAVYAIGQNYLSSFVGVSIKQIGVYVFFSISFVRMWHSVFVNKILQ